MSSPACCRSLLLLFFSACSTPIGANDGGADAGPHDGASDAGEDAGHDAGMDGGPDAAVIDAAVVDAAVLDAGTPADADVDPCGDIGAAGSWESLGGLGAVAGATSATMASVALLSDGTPVVAFREPRTPGGQGDIVIQRWEGSSWAALGSPLDVYPTDAEQPSLIVDPLDRPVVAWSEGSPREVHVWRFEGDEWAPLGAGLSAQPGMFSHAELPSLAVGPVGDLMVAWQEVPDGSTIPSIHVWRWTGGTWEPVGGAVDRLGGATRSIWPDLAIGPSGEPHLAWIENDESGRGETYVARWTGVAWESVGGPLSASVSGEGPSLPVIAFDGSGAPVVAFGDGDASGADVHVRRWDGSVWEELGSPSAALPDVHIAGGPSLVADPIGRLVIAFTAEGSAPGVHVSRRDAAGWISLGTPASAGTDVDVAVSECGDPVVVWHESPGAGLTAAAARWAR